MHVQDSANCLEPLAHALEAVAGTNLAGPLPIVANANIEAIIGSNELDPQVPRARVSNGVRDGLLHAAKDGVGLRWIDDLQICG